MAIKHGFQHKTQDSAKVMHCGSCKVKWMKHLLTSVFIIHPLKWYGATWTYAWPILNIKHVTWVWIRLLCLELVAFTKLIYSFSFYSEFYPVWLFSLAIWLQSNFTDTDNQLSHKLSCLYTFELVFNQKNLSFSVSTIFQSFDFFFSLSQLICSFRKLLAF